MPCAATSQVHRAACSKIAALLRDRMSAGPYRRSRASVCVALERAGPRARNSAAGSGAAASGLGGGAGAGQYFLPQAVLERGFALVRGEDGKVRRRADSLRRPAKP